jgi:hypothetical protein
MWIFLGQSAEKSANATKPRKGYGNGANFGFQAQLFLAADKLRKNLEPSDYKHVALGLIFLKYISNAFEAKRAALLAEDPAAAEDPDDLSCPISPAVGGNVIQPIGAVGMAGLAHSRSRGHLWRSPQNTISLPSSPTHQRGSLSGPSGILVVDKPRHHPQ